jgi:hypothetical protein
LGNNINQRHFILRFFKNSKMKRGPETNTRIKNSDWVFLKDDAVITTGWSAFTTRRLGFKIVGNQMFVIMFIQGTSNSTTAEVVLPVGITKDMMLDSASAFYMDKTCSVRDNGGNFVVGLVRIESQANAGKKFRFFNGVVNFTSSGVKVVRGQWTFPINI